MEHSTVQERCEIIKKIMESSFQVEKFGEDYVHVIVHIIKQVTKQYAMLYENLKVSSHCWIHQEHIVYPVNIEAVRQSVADN